MLSSAGPAQFLGQARHFEYGAWVSRQAQYFVDLGVCVCLRGRGTIWQLSKGTGCCSARGQGLNLRDRRSGDGTRISWQAQYSLRLRVRVCVAAATYGSCLQGLDVVRDQHETFVREEVA